MPIPSKRKDEDSSNFMSRCMSNEKMKEEYPDNKQRTAVCISNATDGMDVLTAGDFYLNYKDYGYTEDVTEENFYVPASAEYEDWGEDSEEWDISVAKPGLWENIRKKKEREGKSYKPAKKGDKDRPDPDSYKKAQSDDDFKPHKMYDKDGKSHMAKTLEDHLRMKKQGYTRAAEYQGRKVTLNKPFVTPDGPKKRSVYVKNERGNVVKVNFGDPNMEIKRDNPKNRKSFRARHKCKTPGPKWKARYWSCKQW